MSHILYLGSQSSSRQQLLREAQIPFQLVTQSADESKCDWGVPWQQLVERIALYKMEHVQLPKEVTKQGTCFVLTADTMGVDLDGVVHGKPLDKQDAIKKIKALRRGGRIGTAFCLDKKIFHDGVWSVDVQIQEFVSSSYEYDMPDEWMEKYFTAVPTYVQVSGAITIEGYGAQFLKSIDGSYTTILGLPMFQLREALERIGFYNNTNRSP